MTRILSSGRDWLWHSLRRAAAVDWVKALRRRRLFRQLFAEKQNLVRKRLFDSDPPIRVLTGPFQGLRYLDEITFGPITPKWLGSYEFEIQDLIENVSRRRYPQIINLGCAEGYYAVGLAWRRPESRVIVFDIDPLARIQVRKLAIMNGLSNRITVNGFCGHKELQSFLTEPSLLLIDIEGNELDILNPSKLPQLRQADILVEIHATDPSNNPERTESLLRERFRASHSLERRTLLGRSEWIQQNREIWQRCLTSEEVLDATNEYRSGKQVWLWMQTKRLESLAGKWR